MFTEIESFKPSTWIINLYFFPYIKGLLEAAHSGNGNLHIIFVYIKQNIVKLG